VAQCLGQFNYRSKAKNTCCNFHNLSKQGLKATDMIRNKNWQHHKPMTFDGDYVLQ